MTVKNEELAKVLAQAGLKVDELSASVREKISAALDAQKAQLDTKTRRTVRAFWGPVGFVVGVIAGYFLHAVIG